MHYICKDCKQMFEITAGEEKFYKDRGLSLPKRCKECREKNKNGGNNAAADGSTRADKGKVDKQTRDIRQPVLNNDDPADIGAKKKSFSPKKILPTVIFVAIALVVMFFMSGRGGKDNTTTPDAADSTASVTQTVTDETANTAAAEDTDTTADTTAQPTTQAPTTAAPTTAQTITSRYRFRNQKLLDQHYQKHGIEMGFKSAEAYQAAASAVIENPDALHKTEAEDGDDVYYVTSTREFVVLSTDGYIRTYYYASRDYFDRQ